MGKAKDAADRASEQIGFRVTLSEKSAVEELAKRRRATTGDASLSGWFRELVRRESGAAKPPISVDEDAPALEAPAPATKPQKGPKPARKPPKK